MKCNHAGEFSLYNKVPSDPIVSARSYVACLVCFHFLLPGVLSITALLYLNMSMMQTSFRRPRSSENMLRRNQDRCLISMYSAVMDQLLIIFKQSLHLLNCCFNTCNVVLSCISEISAGTISHTDACESNEEGKRY